MYSQSSLADNSLEWAGSGWNDFFLSLVILFLSPQDTCGSRLLRGSKPRQTSYIIGWIQSPSQKTHENYFWTWEFSRNMLLVHHRWNQHWPSLDTLLTRKNQTNVALSRLLTEFSKWLKDVIIFQTARRAGKDPNKMHLPFSLKREQFGPLAYTVMQVF